MNSYRNTLGFTFVVCIALMMQGAPLNAVTSAHILPYDSVSNNEIRIMVTKRYVSQTQKAIVAWNKLKKIKLRIVTSDPDVVIRGARLCKAGWDGYYQSGTTGLIRLNSCYVNKYPTWLQMGIIRHELGHALGLNDHFNKKFKNTLMYCCPAYQRTLVPVKHDKKDYYARWGQP